MNQVMIDLWPLLVPILLAAVGWQWRENHQLKIRVAVLETTVVNLETTLTNIQKRQDSQSKKQDDILDRLQSMENEVIERIGKTDASISSLAAQVKGLHDLILISDKGLHIERN
jgi:predicted  nucleic acid-binding Zn-ribbon protein